MVQDHEFSYDAKEHQELLDKQRSIYTFLSLVETRKLIFYSRQKKMPLRLDKTHIEFSLYSLYHLFIREFLDKVKKNPKTISINVNRLKEIEAMLDDMLTEHEEDNITLDLNEYYLKNGLWVESDKAKFSSLCDELLVLSLNVEESLKLAIKNGNSTSQIEKTFINKLQFLYSKLFKIERVALAIEMSKYSKDQESY